MIYTKRLILRPWKQTDFAPFAQMNADPKVLEHFPALLTQTQSDALANRCMSHVEKHGWGLWAVELLDNAEFIGFIGLADVSFSAAFTPATEIGWRLSHKHWGKGYATEGAQQALLYAFETLLLKEVVSFTTLCNKRSQRVMEKLGMTHNPRDDFDHPKLPKDHPLCRHVLYRRKPF